MHIGAAFGLAVVLTEPNTVALPREVKDVCIAELQISDFAQSLPYSQVAEALCAGPLPNPGQCDFERWRVPPWSQLGLLDLPYYCRLLGHTDYLHISGFEVPKPYAISPATSEETHSCCWHCKHGKFLILDLKAFHQSCHSVCLSDIQACRESDN